MPIEDMSDIKSLIKNNLDKFHKTFLRLQVLYIVDTPQHGKLQYSLRVGLAQ
jgi:hypothetical protein